MRGDALLWRTAIAAWRGRHEEAVERLQAARAAGWCDFPALHDRYRVLLEPVAGHPKVVPVLRPSE